MDVPERLILSCAACGGEAASVVIAPPGQPLPQPSFPSGVLSLEEWWVDLTVPQVGGTAYTVDADAAEALRRAVRSGDLGYLRGLGFPIAGSICPDCAAAYCEKHLTVAEVTKGTVAGRGTHFEAVCLRGHRSTFEPL